jgi:tetratricopeptide (TPR) repeat protein
LSTRFTQHGVGQSEPHEADPPVLERQQAVLLEMLRRAAGAPVSYAHLHDAGIEFPASVVSELELAGVSVERCDVHTRDAGRLVGVRIDPPREQFEIPIQSSVFALRDARTSIARVLRALGDSVKKRWLPVAALLAAGSVVAALVLVALSDGGRAHVAVVHRQLRPVVSAAARSHAPAAPEAGAAVGPQARPVPRAAPTPVSPTLAAQLEAQGHEMLEAGRFSEAIAMLDKTLAATGENLQDCLRPASETCLTYAYALYDLGRALRLDGDPAAAVPVLQHRLQIENQRATVQAQLELALAQTS